MKGNLLTLDTAFSQTDSVCETPELLTCLDCEYWVVDLREQSQGQLFCLPRRKLLFTQ